MFTWVIKKCLNLTFKVIFLCQKSFESFLFLSLNNISLEEDFLSLSIFEPLCFLKWCPILDSPCEHLWKSNQKYFYFTDFFAKIYPFVKLHHWGHTKCTYYLTQGRILVKVCSENSSNGTDLQWKQAFKNNFKKCNSSSPKSFKNIVFLPGISLSWSMLIIISSRCSRICNLFVCNRGDTPSSWLTQIRFTRISLTRIFKKFPFLT